jgi:phospholipid N-methyltransferase
MNFGEYLLFGTMFFRNPKMLGSLIPSSRYLSRRLMRQIDWKRARVIVEYGPGIGNVTADMLTNMRSDAVLVAIDTNPEFVSHLRQKFSADRRVHVHLGSAAHVRNVLDGLHIEAADYVVSGIPFTGLPSQLVQSILDETRRVLQPHGTFLVYQFTDAVRPFLNRSFRNVRTEFEPFNVLPARTFECAP